MLTKTATQDASSIVFINGEFCAPEAALVNVNDRAFTFADGVYEGLLYAGGKIFEAQAHYERLVRSASGCGFDLPMTFNELQSVLSELIERNHLQFANAFIYLQISRGVAPRNHPFPTSQISPTVYAFARPLEHKKEWELGCKVLLVPETRGSLCFIKSTALLPNVLARQAAIERGATEAIFIKEGRLTEGSHTNICAIIDETLYTHPANEFILNGVTRMWVIETCKQLNITYKEEAVSLEQLESADEAFICGTTSMITPIIKFSYSSSLSLNNKEITKKVGDITLKLQKALIHATGFTA